MRAKRGTAMVTSTSAINPVTGQTLVNSMTAGNQFSPSFVTSAAGTAVAVAIIIGSMTEVRAVIAECHQTAEAVAVATEAPIDATSDSGFSFLIKPPFHMSLTCPPPDATGDFTPALNIKFESYPATFDFFEVVGTAGAAVVKLPAMLIIKKAQHCFSKALNNQSGQGEVNMMGVMHVDCRVNTKPGEGYYDITVSHRR
jgi:hypothetical protein